ncbi:MAG TPA: lipase maturation factor family protein [Terriglobia bacterium]|nr:lipase maturation factor family protein [Terriglobia bacterium]
MNAEQIWGIFARLLAGIYIIAFASLHAELIPLVGSRGISPVAEKLARIRSDMGGWRGWMRFPTLLWLGSTDGVLRRLPIIGILTALFAACGVLSNIMFGLTWIIYLSFDAALGMTYPWESMLLETGFLAIFLPHLDLLPSVRMSHAPEPILMFAFQWLLFRVLFGFGKTKFTRDAFKDPMYLRSFLICQPILSVLGWRAFRLPRKLLLWPHLALFITEIALPFLVFFAGWPRLTAAAGFTALMVAIQLMGNFGFFNMLVVVLCVTLLDSRSVTMQTLSGLASPGGLITIIVVAWSVIAGLIHLPFNTWAARGWLDWPVWGKLGGIAGRVLQFLRTAMPFRTVHAYGVFPPRLGPPLKFMPVIEGTLDGKHWEPFEYKYTASTEKSRPPFVAPHCPRIDHFVLYDGYGIVAGNFLGNIFSQGNPYDFSSVTVLERLMERLMEPDSPVRQLFRSVPFNETTPKRMRASLYIFAPTRPEELRATGRYWDRIWIDEHVPERGPDPSVFSRWLPAPEQFHPDERWARRLVPRLQPLLDARDLETIRKALPPRPQLLWQTFWEDVIPNSKNAVQGGWAEVDALSIRLKKTYGPIDLEHLDCIRAALMTALMERLEPRTKVRSYFHAALIANVILLYGPQYTGAALRDGTCRPAETESEIESKGLMVFTVFRRNMMRQHAKKHRLAEQTLPPMAPPPDGIPGFSLTTHLLARGLPDAVEKIPELRQGPDGKWSMNGVLILER